MLTTIAAVLTAALWTTALVATLAVAATAGRSLWLELRGETE